MLTPILDENVFKELKHILNLQLSDTIKARLRYEEGENHYVGLNQNDSSIRSQYAIN